MAKGDIETIPESGARGFAQTMLANQRRRIRRTYMCVVVHVEAHGTRVCVRQGRGDFVVRPTGV